MPRPHFLTFEEDIIERLSRIETKVEAGATQGDDHEKRIRAVEKKQWLLAGVAAGLAPMLNRLGIHLPILG